jgi:SAM-dependent methyltransferase
MIDSRNSFQEIYSQDFYRTIEESSKKSAEVIVPMILERVHCDRIIDVGCGDGTWLKVFHEQGVREILGVDGIHVDENILVIPKENFKPFDLINPLQFEQTFDLVISLEVAEHLPPEAAGTFVESLTSLGSVILFSAAIPHQPGEHHINPQWIDYWVKLFQDRNYVAIDCIRPHIWNHQEVAFWFSQNILVFVKQEELINYPLLKKEFEETHQNCLSIVHPSLYLKIIQDYSNILSSLITEVDPEKMSPILTFKKIPIMIKSAITRKLKRIFSKAKTYP